MTEILRSQFVGMHELRKNLSKLVKTLEEEGREIVVTRQGKPAAVIVDLESTWRCSRRLLEARREILRSNLSGRGSE